MQIKVVVGLLAAMGALNISCRVAIAEDTIKVGVVLPLTGPFTGTGKQILSGARLYLQRNGDRVAGKKIELVVRDGGNAPDQSKRLTQELIVTDKVSLLAGYGLTPIAFAAAPLATNAEMPMVVMGAATSSLTEKSPFIVRTSFAQSASPYLLGTWLRKNGTKTAVTVVSDFAPGYDSEAAFSSAFQAAGARCWTNFVSRYKAQILLLFCKRRMSSGLTACSFSFPPGKRQRCFANLSNGAWTNRAFNWSGLVTSPTTNF